MRTTSINGRNGRAEDCETNKHPKHQEPQYPAPNPRPAIKAIHNQVPSNHPISGTQNAIIQYQAPSNHPQSGTQNAIIHPKSGT